MVKRGILFILAVCVGACASDAVNAPLKDFSKNSETSSGDALVNTAIMAVALVGRVNVGHLAVSKDGSPTSIALSGKIFLKQQFPVPLSNLQLRLNKIENDKFIPIVDFTTERDGSFAISRPIKKGNYQLLVIDPRYRGEFKISLQESVQNQIFEIESNIQRK